MAILKWLGQSGFLLEADGIRFACDLYLSDYCKQRSKLDHTRLLPIPVAPEALERIDYYLITHIHIDHFDPLTVGPILRSQIATRFYCPPVGRSVIGEFFPEERTRFTLLFSKTEYTLSSGVRLLALPAAHEELEKDTDGEYIAFSYLLLLDVTKQAVFFAGDTISFVGQGGMIRKAVPLGYALTMVLPVNGRDQRRATLGFKGNLTLAEAIGLCNDVQASLLVPCHFGMFALNDIPEKLVVDFFRGLQAKFEIPEVGQQIHCAVNSSPF